MSQEYGNPTFLDNVHSMAFANMMVNKLKCNDPEVIKTVCSGSSGGGTCIQWENRPESQTFPSPFHIYSQECKNTSDCDVMGICVNGKCVCDKDSDCLNGMKCIQNPNSPSDMVCGFNHSDMVAGHCLFTNETACVAHGNLPYTCDFQGYCTRRKKDDPLYNSAYTEWRPETSKCVLGNYVLRQWCENPGSRCEKNSDGSYPAQCQGDQTRGVTTVPPFFYDTHTGNCLMTNDYCQNYGKEYNMSDCSSSNDCAAGQYCNITTDSSTCVGAGAECQESTGDKIGKFFLGNTLFYMFKKGECKGQGTGTGTHTDGSTTENYTANSEKNYTTNSQKVPTLPLPFEKNILSKFDNSPLTAVSYFSQKHLKHKIIIGNNFGGNNIHLYRFYWKNGKKTIGFIPKEVEAIYPNIVDENFIILDRKVLTKNTKFLNRIYLVINSQSWLNRLIFGDN